MSNRTTSDTATSDNSKMYIFLGVGMFSSSIVTISIILIVRACKKKNHVNTEIDESIKIIPREFEKVHQPMIDAVLNKGSDLETINDFFTLKSANKQQIAGLLLS